MLGSYDIQQSKTAFQVEKGEKLCIVIALGYGETQGLPHKSKSMEEVIQLDEPAPEWFQKGVEAALLAPTAMNQQKFLFRLDKNRVSVKAGFGFYTKIDMRIENTILKLVQEKSIFSGSCLKIQNSRNDSVWFIDVSLKHKVNMKPYYAWCLNHKKA